MSNKYYLGVLVLVILAASVYVMLPQSVKISVSETSATFYTWNETKWSVSAVEYSRLFNGTKSLSADYRNVNYSIRDNKTNITRTAKFGGVYLIDTYVFNGSVSDKENVPISETHNVLNGKGLTYVYEVQKLPYNGTDLDLTGKTEFQTGIMKIKWQEGNYYAKIFSTKTGGKLTLKYKVNSNDQIFNIRLFDPWWNTSFSNYQNDSVLSNVGVNLVNFPYLANGSWVDTATLVSGGKMLSTCKDLAFINETGNEVPYEFENYYDGLFGCNKPKTTIWVNPNTVKSDNSTKVSMYYGYSGEVAFHNNTNAVWDSNFTGVYHLSSFRDSTKYLHNLSTVGTAPIINDTGMFANSTRFVAGALKNASFSGLTNLGNMTLEGWFKPDVTMTSATGGVRMLQFNSGTKALYYQMIGAGTGKLECVDSATNSVYANFTTNLNSGQWYHIACVSNKTNRILYLNGTAVSVAGNDARYGTPGTDLAIGGGADGTSPFKGLIDEVRISNASRDASYFKRTYEQGLASLGAEESQTAAPANIYLNGLEQDRKYEYGTKANVTVNGTAGSTFCIMTDLYNEGNLTCGASPLYYNYTVGAYWEKNSSYYGINTDTPSMRNALVGMWMFEGVNATNYTKDISAYSNDGKIITVGTNPSAMIDNNGKKGNALLADGITGNFVNIENKTSLNLPSNFTVMGWFKFTTADHTNRGILQKGINPTNYIVWGNLSGNVVFTVSGLSPGTVYMNPNPQTNVWYHFAGVYNGTALSIYINGVLNQSVAVTGSPSINSNYNFSIGANPSGNAPFAGLIDEIRIYNRSILQQEITDYYNDRMSFVLNLSQNRNLTNSKINITGIGDGNNYPYDWFIDVLSDGVKDLIFPGYLNGNILNQTYLSSGLNAEKIAYSTAGSVVRYVNYTTSTSYSAFYNLTMSLWGELGNTENLNFAENLSSSSKVNLTATNTTYNSWVYDDFTAGEVANRWSDDHTALVSAHTVNTGKNITQLANITTPNYPCGYTGRPDVNGNGKFWFKDINLKSYNTWKYNYTWFAVRYTPNDVGCAGTFNEPYSEANIETGIYDITIGSKYPMAILTSSAGTPAAPHSGSSIMKINASNNVFYFYQDEVYKNQLSFDSSHNYSIYSYVYGRWLLDMVNGGGNTTVWTSISQINASGAGARYTGSLLNYTPGRIESLNVFNFTGTLLSAKLTGDDVKPEGTAIQYYLSANNGTNWEATTSGNTLTFANVGRWLKYKAEIYNTSANIKDTARIRSVNIIVTSGNATNVSIDIGADGSVDWNYPTQLNATNSPQTVQLSNSTIQSYISSNCGSALTCLVPVKITSNTTGTLNITNISGKMTLQNINLLYRNASLINSHLANNNLTNMTFGMTNGTMEVKDLVFTYPKDFNITVTAFNMADKLKNITRTIMARYSQYNITYPTSYQKIGGFKIKTNNDTNLTPFGQSDSIPVWNITASKFNTDSFNLAVKLNETPNSCLNFKANNVSYAGNATNLSTTYKFIQNNTGVGISKGIWWWLDLANCGAGMIQLANWSVRSICESCIWYP